MVDIRRAGKADNGRIKLKLPNYSAPFNYINQNDAFDTAISKLDAAIKDELNAKTHNSLQAISGDSPYYHIAIAIYQALVPYGGYTPGSGNPFATVDWVGSQITSSNFKRAWGTANPDTWVYLDSAHVGSGYYNGDTGFAEIPAVCISNYYGTGQTNNHHHGWVIGYSSLTKDHFYISRSNYGIHNPRCYWFAVGK